MNNLKVGESIVVAKARPQPSPAAIQSKLELAKEGLTQFGDRFFNALALLSDELQSEYKNDFDMWHAHTKALQQALNTAFTEILPEVKKLTESTK